MSGTRFKAAIGEFPGQLAKRKDSYRQGASALRRWSADLDGAQADADRALALGRQARADLESAQAALGSAQTSAGSASSSASSAQQLAAKYADTPPPAGVQVPDPDAVRSSVRTAQIAQSRVNDAHAAVGDAQSRLDAARKMALDAKDLRESRGKVAASHINDAAHAGIKPNSFMENLGNLAGQVWDAVITIAKVVVAVLGIVALIIGGPIAWIVFAAAVLILADTIAKAIQGKATGWDIAWAALGCIPGTKGLTTFKALSGVFKEAGTLAAVGHVVKAGGTAVMDMANGIRTMASDLRSLPADLHLAIDAGRKSFAEAAADIEHMNVLKSLRVTMREVSPIRLEIPVPGMAMMDDGTAAAGAALSLSTPSRLPGLAATFGKGPKAPFAMVIAAKDAASEAAQVFGSVRTAQMVLRQDGTYDVLFKYSKKWDEFQRASADAKAAKLQKLVEEMPTNATPRNPANTARFARENPASTAEPKQLAQPFDGKHRLDVDHMRDLQLEGVDQSSNMWYMDSSVNRSEGAQLSSLLRKTEPPAGAGFNSFTFIDRGDGLGEALGLAGHVSRGGSIALVAR